MLTIKVLIVVISTICFLNSIKQSTANFAEDNDQFALNFYQQLVQDEENIDKSIVFSPLSLQIAGGLLFAGSNGNTASEIRTGFNLPGSNLNTVNDAFKEYFNNQTELLSSGQMNIANKMYIMNGYSLRSTFNNIAVKYYNSAIDNIDFNDAVTSANTINSWVEQNTDGKIQNLVDSDSIDAFTRMYLVNAIHFKGEWESQFDPKFTQNGLFFVTPRKHAMIPMMYQAKNFETNNFDDLRAIGVNLKFKNSDLSLFMIMPEYMDKPLSELENQLNDMNLLDLFNSVSEDYVGLTMPKFKIEFSTDLTKSLKGLNINQMFDNSADFSNILDTTEQLAVNEAVHKAVLEIDEVGGEASAATGFAITSRRGPVELNFNHPFLYFIKSSQGEIYFMGRFTGQ